ncbi:MAG TPA: hypothetical protein PLI14_06530 [Bacilli bacterium]|nr:hypothetical protein [Bacilli bacterium]
MLFTENELDLGGAGCFSCRLRKKERHLAQGTGKIPLLIIGSSPTKSGHISSEFRDILQQVDIDINKCRFMSSVCCPVPDDKQPTLRDIEFCRSNVWREIRNNKPNAVILLGEGAMNSVLGKVWRSGLGNIKRWEGLIIPLRETRSWVLCLRDERELLFLDGKENTLLKNIWISYLKKFISFIDKGFPKELQNYPQTEHLYGDDRVRYLKKLIEKKPKHLAFDYETNCLRPQLKNSKIVSVSFSDTNDLGVAMLFDKTIVPYLKKIYRSKFIGKIASNMKFEHIWTSVKLGIEIRNWVHDTMLCAHVEDNRELYSGLKMQVFVNFGIPDYAEKAYRYITTNERNGYNDIFEMNTNDLLEYNALDSVFEYRLAKMQMRCFI